MVRAFASHQCGPGSNLGVNAICGLSLLLVLFFALRGFSPGTAVFPSPLKPTFANSYSTRNQVDKKPLCGCATSKSLFIDLFILNDIIYPRSEGEGVIDSPLKVFLSFFLEGNTLATYVFSSCSFIPSTHFDSGLVMDSFYDYEIWHHK